MAPIGDVGQIAPTPNRSDPPPGTESAVALAGAHGADDNTGERIKGEGSAACAPRHPPFSDHAAALRAIGFALSCDTPHAWAGAGTMLRAHLTPYELESLAVIAGAGAGRPMVPLADPEAEAKEWASWATEGELAAYLWASWCALPDRRRDAFRAHVNGRVAA